jgi:hypothetical protein
MINATVSGSFHRHLAAISSSVLELHEYGIKVLSPADPRIVDSLDEFLFVASDRIRSVRLVQDRHLESIRGADFVWLVAPDGYVGQSAAMEVGFAVANSVPIFGLHRPNDLTLRQYVRTVHNLREAIRFVQSAGRSKPRNLLIDPHASVEHAQAILEQIGGVLEGSQRSSFSDIADEVYSRCADVTDLLRLPGRNQLFGS